MSLNILLSFVLGLILGYIVFYLRFQHKDTINNLRSNLKDASKELQKAQEILEEYTAQNTILKDETIRLLEKNDDLTDIVTELSKYYVHIKKAAEKTTELNKFLHEPNSEIEDKINEYTSKSPSQEKKFF